MVPTESTPLKEGNEEGSGKGVGAQAAQGQRIVEVGFQEGLS